MGELIDFSKYKDKKIVEQIEFIPSRHESYCPFCEAPTLIQRTSRGADIHTFDPTNMEAYDTLKKLLVKIVDYFLESEQGVTPKDLVEAFGEGMKDFLKELEGNPPTE